MQKFPQTPYSAIQMIGTQRSGSNLLRLMLNQLPEVYAPHPPHILMVFYPLLHHYGDLNNPENFKTLINDVCTYIELNPVPWDNADLDREKVFNLCKRRTLLEIFIKINELQCIEKNKTIWCCKSLETIYFIDNFGKEDFRPFIIYLVRDGRDVAVSFRKILIGEKHIYYLAAKWKKEQELALKYIGQLPAEDHILLKYEDLIADPSRYVEEICAKLGIRYNPSILNYYSSGESHRTAEAGKMWENVDKPVLKTNTGKYLSELSRNDLRIFETVAGDVLENLGYKREIPASEEIKFTGEQIKDFGIENERLKKLATQSASPKDLLKRKPQKDFIDNLLKGFSSGKQE